MDKMMFLVLLIVAAVMSGCVSRPVLQNVDAMAGFFLDGPSEESNLPKLVVDAHPRVGFAPLRVTVRAVLKNVPSNDPVFGCMWQSWAFGDGAVSSEKPNCDGPGIVHSEYYVEHIYKEEGIYTIRFAIGDNQVLSNPVDVRVVARNY